jgi:hypothetical protein
MNCRITRRSNLYPLRDTPNPWVFHSNQREGGAGNRNLQTEPTNVITSQNELISVLSDFEFLKLKFPNKVVGINDALCQLKSRRAIFYRAASGESVATDSVHSFKCSRNRVLI